MTLHATINSLASEFAHELLRALRNASLDEIIAETAHDHRSHATHPVAHAKHAAGGGGGGARRARGGKRHRRSSADLTSVVEKIISTVKSHKNGINAEGIRAALKLPRKELPRPIQLALATKKIKKKGERRATTYFGA
jgi:hypothetical protein